MRKKDINIRFIAEKCGVSTATVSRVLNEDARVSKDTRKKVLNAIDVYGYNLSAAARPKVHKVGVIMRINNPDYNTGLLRSISDYFFARSIQVIACNAERDYSRIPETLDTLYDSGVMGVILIRCPYLEIKEHLNPRIPHVWLDCNDSPEDCPNICCTQSDHYTSGQIAALELLNHGCTRPILINGIERSHRTFERNQGFISEYEKKGIHLEENHFLYLPSIKDAFSESQDIVRYLLTKNFPFDGVFAVSDWRALGAYMGVKSMGKSIPKDIKIIGFDGISLASRSVLNITCVQQNVSQLAFNACRQLECLIDGQTVKNKHVIVPTGILPGQTI